MLLEVGRGITQPSSLEPGLHVFCPVPPWSRWRSVR